MILASLDLSFAGALRSLFVETRIVLVGRDRACGARSCLWGTRSRRSAVHLHSNLSRIAVPLTPIGRSCPAVNITELPATPLQRTPLSSGSTPCSPSPAAGIAPESLTRVADRLALAGYEGH